MFPTMLIKRNNFCDFLFAFKNGVAFSKLALLLKGSSVCISCMLHLCFMLSPENDKSSYLLQIRQTRNTHNEQFI